MPSEPLPPFPHGDFIYTESPNPNYTPGQRVDATEHGKKWLQKFDEYGTKTIDIAQENPRFVCYQLTSRPF